MPNFGTNKKPSVHKVSKHEHGPGMSFWVGPTKAGTTAQGNMGPMKIPKTIHKGKKI